MNQGDTPAHDHVGSVYWGSRRAKVWQTFKIMCLLVKKKKEKKEEENSWHDSNGKASVTWEKRMSLPFVMGSSLDA